MHYSVICESQQVSSCCCQFERNCSKLELLEAVECCRWRSTRWKCRWHFPSPGFGSLAPHGTAASTATVRSIGCPSIALLPTLCRFHFTGGSAIMLCQFIYIYIKLPQDFDREISESLPGPLAANLGVDEPWRWEASGLADLACPCECSPRDVRPSWLKQSHEIDWSIIWW